MTIKERHEEVTKIIARLKVLHEKYFPPARPLTDQEWEEYINGIWAVADDYKDTNLENFAAELTMVFSDDIENVHKAWEKRRGYEIQEAKQE